MVTAPKRYYKATRLDGTDFYTGTVDYAAALSSGELLKHPRKRRKDDPSTYFSVATVPTGCTGMGWPCRLFTVQGIGRGLKATNLPNTRAFSALRVESELPAYQVFGPQGAEVVALIAPRKTLTPAETARLDAAWDATKDGAWDAAWALVVRDLISQKHFDTLYGPWAAVMGVGQ